MQVPFVDLAVQIKPYIHEIKPVLEDVIYKRADFIMRDDLLAFEKEFSEFIGVKHAVGVANGSDALNLCVMALGIRPGDEVITVAHTFVATIASVVHTGATPVLIDIADDYNMEPELLEGTITERTKAIIVVHLNGRICDMEPIIDIAKKYNLFIIEDAAQACGATYNSRKAGSFGILSTFSFYPFKVIGCFGDGGMITTNDSGLNYKLRCMRDNGQDRQKGELLFWGWNSRLDNLQAAVLSVMLKYHSEIVSRRRELAEIYNKNLSHIKDLLLPPEPVNDKYYDVFQNYVIRTKKRDELIKYLNSNEIGTLISWPRPTHFHERLGLSHFSLPNTESVSREVLSLPMHPALKEEEVIYVCDTVNKFFNKK